MPGYPGKQGRKPKPGTIAERERRYLRSPSGEVKTDLPTCPFHGSKHEFDREACKAWHRLVKELGKAGIIQRLDGDALTLYCTAWARWVDAEARLREFGPVMMDRERKRPVLSPYWRIANTAMEQMKSLLGEFGLSPASRSRIPRKSQEETPRSRRVPQRTSGDPRDLLR